MKKKFNKEFLIGLSVIVALLILFFGIDYLKGVNLFKPANYYEVYYTDVSGLAVSSPVQINGYKVGQVRSIDLDYKNPGKVKVTLALDKSLHLPEGTEAQMGQTLLSGAFINLVMGKGPGEMKMGSELKAASTPDLMAAVQQDVLPAIGNILPKLDSLLYNLNKLTADPALAQSIGRFDGITSNIFAASQGLNATMVTINSRVPGILSNADKAVVHIDTIAYNLALLSQDLRTLPLKPTMDNVERLTSNLQAFSNQLNNSNSTLGKLTNDPALYNQLNRVAADVDSLIVDIKRNPKRYISIKLL